jgi:hypothetical protein
MCDELDLRNHQYSIDILEKHINELSVKELIKYQILTPKFIAQYCWDEKDMSVEESYLIDTKYILRNQPHISSSELLAAIREAHPTDFTT